MTSCAKTAVEVMRHLCEHDSHGYSQYSRWGDGGTEEITANGLKFKIATGDRDCSSAVITAWKCALIGTAYEGRLDGATYTGNMRSVFVNSGLFEVWDTNSTYAQAGDVYLNDACHTAMCISPEPDLLGEFSISETGGIDGAEGDQTGWESHITGYYSYPWNCTLHYNGKADSTFRNQQTKKVEEHFLMAQQNEFLYIVEPDNCGKLFLVDGTRINHIPNPEALKYLQQEYRAVTGTNIPARKIGSKKYPEGLRLFQALGHEELYRSSVEPTSK